MKWVDQVFCVLEISDQNKVLEDNFFLILVDMFYIAYLQKWF
jgi:hypothetical protein